jgi:hypothetical protein
MRLAIVQRASEVVYTLAPVARHELAQPVGALS